MHLLVVEDDARIAEFVADGFRRDGHTVTCAVDGEEGLYFAQSGAFDAIVLDILLPKLNGLELLRRLRGSGSKGPVIVLSARGSVESKVEGLEAGADDYLAKPFCPNELLARVNAILRRTFSRTSQRIAVRGLSIDIQEQTVTYRKRKIALTLQEYKILEYLALNARRIRTITMIYQEVWKQGTQPPAKVVETRVSHLRKKLACAGASGFIHTVRGFGYVLK